MRREGVENKKLLWGMEAYQTSSIYEPPIMFYHLPGTSANGTVKTTQVSSAHLLQNRKQILIGSKTSHTQGQHTWRHNQVLKCLVGFLETGPTSINALPLPLLQPTSAIQFVREGAKKATGQLGGATRLEVIGGSQSEALLPT